MAGDYIPMDHDLPDKPEFLAIIEATGDSVEVVFYRLFKLWKLADGQTLDGILKSCGPRSLASRCGGTPEFWLAVEAVTKTEENPDGWLLFKDGNAIIPRFKERFGKCAKRRRIEARERKQAWRHKQKTGQTTGPITGHTTGHTTGQSCDTTRDGDGTQTRTKAERNALCPTVRHTAAHTSEVQIADGHPAAEVIVGQSMGHTTGPTVGQAPPKNQNQNQNKNQNQEQEVVDTIAAAARPLSPVGDGAALTLAGLIEVWNTLPEVRKSLTQNKSRQTAFRARMGERFFREHWREALAKFPLRCCLGPDAWKPDLDWFLRPKSVASVLEGKYDFTKGGGHAAAERIEGTTAADFAFTEEDLS